MDRLVFDYSWLTVNRRTVRSFVKFILISFYMRDYLVLRIQLVLCCSSCLTVMEINLPMISPLL